MNPTATPPASIDDDNKLIAERREKLKALRAEFAKKAAASAEAKSRL